jgi:hypothetical protein
MLLSRVFLLCYSKDDDGYASLRYDNDNFRTE